MYPKEKGVTMKKMIYKLEYRNFIGRSCVREYRATCIVTVMDEAKMFVQINHIKVAKIITPSGKKYYVV